MEMRAKLSSRRVDCRLSPSCGANRLAIAHLAGCFRSGGDSAAATVGYIEAQESCQEQGPFTARPRNSMSRWEFSVLSGGIQNKCHNDLFGGRADTVFSRNLHSCSAAFPSVKYSAVLQFGELRRHGSLEFRDAP